MRFLSGRQKAPVENRRLALHAAELPAFGQGASTILDAADAAQAVRAAGRDTASKIARSGQVLNPMKPNTVTVDVRDHIRNGLEPFSKIMRAIAALRPDDQLLVIAPFEPVPLYRVMEKHGFQHTTRQSAPDTWEVLFTRGPQVQSTQ